MNYAAPEPLPILELAHHRPGVIRLRSVSFRADSAGKSARELLAFPAVTNVEHNPRTGSLLIAYAMQSIDPDTLIDRVAEHFGLKFVERARPRPVRPTPVAKGIIRLARELDDLTSEALGRKVDLRALAPMTLAAAAMYSFSIASKSQRVPRWDSLAYWAFAMFTQLHWRELEPTPVASTPTDE